MTQEFKNIHECQAHLRATKQKKAVFYFNVFGWTTYYTLEPTFATPSGNLKKQGYPREVEISTRMNKPKII